MIKVFVADDQQWICCEGSEAAALAKRRSQLEPTRSYKIKTCIGGWPNDTAKSSQLARNHSIVWIRPHGHTTMTKQLGESWLRWPNGGKLGSSWAKIWDWSNSNQLDRTWAKWVAERYLTRANSSWEYRLVRALHRKNLDCVRLQLDHTASRACNHDALRHLAHERGLWKWSFPKLFGFKSAAITIYSRRARRRFGEEAVDILTRGAL